jgi:HK97 family phage major capsid protein
VNPEEIRRLLDEKVGRLTELKGLASLTDEQRSEVRTLIDEAKELRSDLNSALEAESFLDEHRSARNTSRGRASEEDQLAGREENRDDDGEEETRSVGEFITDSEEYRTWSRGNRAGALEFEVETRTLFTTTTLPSSYLQAQRLPGIQRDSDTYGSLRDVLLVGSTNAESLIYFREDVFTNNAAPVLEATATTGSTGLKPESAISFDEETAGMHTIAHWIPITKQTEWAAPEMRSYIDGRLLDGLQLAEDEQLLLGDGSSPNMTGLLETSDIQELDNSYFTGEPTQNASTDAEPFDRLARAKRMIADVGRARANFIVINPEDDEFFQTVMDANGHYYAGGPFNAGTAQTIWGLRKVVNEHMPQGQALVGDGRQAQIWDRMTARISVGLVNDQFIRNMKTVLAEKRVGLAVYRPKAFAVVDLFSA